MTRPGQPPELSAIFKALCVETRVRIIQELKGQPLCVNALAARLGVTHSAVSQHLRVLRDAGLVQADRRGYWVHYRLDEHGMATCAKAVEAFFRP